MKAVEGWETKTLGELAIINYGKSPIEVLAPDGLYPVVGTGGTERRGNDYLYEGDSIILGRKGTIDRVHFATGRFWTIDTAYYLSDFSESVPLWLFYFLQTIDLRQMNEATGVPSLSRDVLYKVEVPTPPKPEQTKIAEILSTVDRAIEQTDALIAKQQRVKTGLMQDLLSRGIDEHGNLRSEQTHQFKDSPLGRIPVEWGHKELGNVAFVTKLAGFEFTIYFDYKAGGEIIALRALNIKNEHLDLSDIQRISKTTSDKLPRSKIFTDDILITYIGAYIGDILRIGENDKYHLAPNIAKVAAGKSLKPSFLEVMLRSSLVQKQIKNLIVTTATPSLTMTQIRTLLIAVPHSKDEQDKITARLQSTTVALDTVNSKAQKIRRLKNALMQDLLTGKKRVTAVLKKEASML